MSFTRACNSLDCFSFFESEHKVLVRICLLKWHACNCFIFLEKLVKRIRLEVEDNFTFSLL